MRDNKILRLLYPRHCVICDRALKPSDNGICEGCKKIPLIVPAPRCDVCGKHIYDPSGLCYDCSIKRPNYNYGRALYEYRSLSESIHRFKNSGRVEYGRYYGERIAALLGDEIKAMHAEALIPVPMHKDKLRLRGYNQAKVLADQISAYLDIPVVDDLVVHSGKSKDQKNLGIQERQNNLKKAFNITKNGVKLNDIIVVDDVYTTGSTIKTITSLLEDRGVENVYFITLAIGKGR